MNSTMQDLDVKYDEAEDMTSWTYFKKHFQAYLSGERFPIAEMQE